MRWVGLLRLTEVAVVALMLMPLACAAADNGRCGAGKDLVVQALERAGPQSSASDFEDALQLLKRASAVCGELGDAWYYRSLVEARLGHAGPAKFATDQAKLLGSDALGAGLQPFVLATPITRRSIGGGGTGAPGGGTVSGPAGPVQQKWALVVGIGKFADRNIPSLNYTSGDAQAFAALLSDPAVGKFPKANVHVLTDDQATTKGIREGLNWIARHAQPNDMVVIYLATHGSPRETDSVGGLNYIVTYDTEIHSTDHPDEDALYATALPMVDLSSAVASRLHALRTLVVLDTCFSGGAVNSLGKNGGRMMGAGLANAAPSPATLQRMSEGSGRIVMAASQVDQESLESDTLHHGYFTYFLLKQLRDSKGMKPLSQVYADVQHDVSERVAADGKAEGLHQNPVMDRSSDEADFALGLAGTAAVASVGQPTEFAVGAGSR